MSAAKLTIFVVLACVIAAGVWEFVQSQIYGGTTGRSGTAEERIIVLCVAVQAFKARTGVLPTNEQGLMALVKRPDEMKENGQWVQLLGQSNLVDGWKTPFAYHAPARKGKADFEIVSAGMDRVMNTEDDISSVKDEE